MTLNVSSIGAPCSTHTVSGTTDSGERPRRYLNMMISDSKMIHPGGNNPGSYKQPNKKQRTMTYGSTQRLSKQKRQNLGVLSDKVHYNKCYQYTFVDVKCTHRTRYHHPKENGPKKEVQGAALRLARKGKNFNFSRCQGEKCKIKNCENDHYHACSCSSSKDKCTHITKRNLVSRLTKNLFVYNPDIPVFVPQSHDQDRESPYGTPCNQDRVEIKKPQINVLDIPVSSAVPDSKSEIFVSLKNEGDIDAGKVLRTILEEEEKVVDDTDIPVDKKEDIQHSIDAPHKYPIDTHVRAAWRGQNAWRCAGAPKTFSAVIRGHNADGSYDVHYTDGDHDDHVAEEYISSSILETEQLEERMRKKQQELCPQKPEPYKTSIRTLWYNPNAMEMKMLQKPLGTRIIDGLSQFFLRNNTIRTTQKTNFVGNKMVTCHMPGVLTPWKVAARTDEENIEYVNHSSIIGRVVSADKYSIAFHDNYVASRSVTVFDALYDVLIMSVSGTEINTASEKNKKLSLVRAAGKAAIIRAYRTTCQQQMDKLAETGSCDPRFKIANAQNPCRKGEVFDPMDRSAEEHAEIVDNTISVAIQYVHKRSAENLGLGVAQQ